MAKPKSILKYLDPISAFGLNFLLKELSPNTQIGGEREREGAGKRKKRKKNKKEKRGYQIPLSFQDNF
ncbi:hypothetical protein LWI29_002431 [Acer saccharum]|uniref:Uncharacterized protein n=1 Tax=Acer saccharum TaxID=4024 RepID=A0AA39S261_ACESA|nr:hypothetical protein LWI29_002431 [Acer saccharum]